MGALTGAENQQGRLSRLPHYRCIMGLPDDIRTIEKREAWPTDS
jgi:hypothetical protein